MTIQSSLDFTTPVFYNTIGLKSDTLKQAIQDTAIQDARVLRIFESGCRMTPWECWDRLNGEIFIVDVRRAINTLTDKGILIKTDEQKMERKGKPNFIWVIAKNIEN